MKWTNKNPETLAVAKAGNAKDLWPHEVSVRKDQEA
jgi:hypothetical protein